ncbi:zinc finger CCCH domain-containing protein 19-like [Vigna unguiculata]|uniref:zinc finger CCCH domain-containing protein 19-like n=1 Tax=Vigna unguiculata TaxID=3917 RepID=UPI001015E341|nr:zinc finger CCCH domain-containing protein 19-like [Vigna unguiculata]
MFKNMEKTTATFLEKEEEEEKPSEEWCFGCKDGGQMIICDHPGCKKVYHPICVGKDAGFFEHVHSWLCSRHFCCQCNDISKFHCLACPKSLCRKCFGASEEFTVVRGVKGLCIDCWKLMEIVEQNLDHDSNGNKIALNDRETYECLFKEYWEIIKVEERLTSEHVFAAQPDFRTCKPFQHHKENSKGEEKKVQNELKEGSRSDAIFAESPDYKKFESLLHHKKVSEVEEAQNEVKEGFTGDVTYVAHADYEKFKSFKHHKKISKVEEEEEESEDEEESEEEESEEEEEDDEEEESDEGNGLMSFTSDEDSKSAKRKRSNAEEFVGWGSKPLISFLESIGKHGTEPLTKWNVNSLIHEYIKVKSLDHPRYKEKFLPDERLFPIFKKKVVSKGDIYYLLEFHIAKRMDDSFEDKNNVQISNSSLDQHLNAKKSCIQSNLSTLIGKPPLRKGESFIKHSHFASINAHNIKLIYLKRSLVLEFSKQPESFLGKIVGTFVRARMDSNDPRQGKSYHLVRVSGVEFDETSKRTLLQVSIMPKAIAISELSDEDFTEQECEDLQQKVKASLLPKLTVAEVQEKAESLHEDIKKHSFTTRLVHLQNQIDRANLRGRNKEKIALLEERERLEQLWKQEQLIKSVPSVRAELVEAKCGDSEDKVIPHS